MTRHTFLAALLAPAMLAAPMVLPSVALAEDAPAADAQKDAVGSAVRAEIDALGTLVKAIEADVKGGSMEMSKEAMMQWKQAREAWTNVREAAKAKQYAKAYKGAAMVREKLRAGIGEALAAKPSKDTGKAFAGYMDAVNGRMKAMTDRMKNYDVSTEAREHALVGKANFEEAQSAYKGKKYGEAVRKLDASLAELEHVMREVYPDSREDKKASKEAM